MSVLKVKVDTSQDNIKTLQEQNKKLNKDLKDAQTAKLQRQEQARIESARLLAEQRAMERPPVGGNCEQYRSIISQYSWNVETAVAVCNAESGGIASKNHEDDNHKICLGSRGLFQIGCDSTSNFEGMFEPGANIAQAYSLYANRNWQPWSVCYNGAVDCF